MKWILSFLIFFAPLHSLSKIESIHSITEMEFYLDEENHTLAVFDIDDALTILSDPAFHRPNFKIHHSTAFTKIMEPLSAKERLLTFTLPLLTTSGELIEKETPQFFEKLRQRKKMKTVALTAAMGGKIDGVFIEDRRHAELSRVGIDFSLSFPDVSEIVFTDFNAPILGSYPLFKNGLLLTNENDKGEVLVQFLRVIPWKPTLIVFIDDRIEHLLAVQKSLQLYYPEIAFIGLHFKTDRVNYKNMDVEHFIAKWSEHAEKAKEILARIEESREANRLQ